MLAFLFVDVAAAVDLYLYVDAPGAEAVWEGLNDVSPGATKDIVIDGRRKQTYLVAATVQQPSKHGYWRTAITVRSKKRPRAEPEVAATQVLEARLGETATLVVGEMAPGVDRQAARSLRGATIECTVRIRTD